MSNLFIYHLDNRKPMRHKYCEGHCGLKKVTVKLLDQACAARSTKQPKVSSLRCGDGTVEKKGYCVLAESACREGTRLQHGACVAEQSQENPCHAGTRWNISTGKCHVDCGQFDGLMRWDENAQACIRDSSDEVPLK